MHDLAAVSYAVVQQGLDAPSAEQVKRAFRGAAGLTEIDAQALGPNAFGIFARGFELELATALRDSFIKEGVAAEVLDDASLPQLPEPFELSRLYCTPEALHIYDSLDRTATLQWTDIFMIAAGEVGVREFVEIRTSGQEHISETQFKIMKYVDGRLAATDRRRVGGKHPHWEVRPVDIQTREEQHDRQLLEIIMTGGTLRYSLNADKAPLLTSSPEHPSSGNAKQHFLMVVRDLIKYAPHAALNRGACAAQDNDAEPFYYPNKMAFYNEIIWLLWQSTTPDNNSPASEESN